MADGTAGLAPRYAPAAVEPRIYERWLASGAFTPAAEPPAGAERFVITMPPPNVTGSLHTGHALFVTAEDILIRYHRMRGDDTLWVPGVDHASIAAQFVLDKMLATDGLDRAAARPRGVSGADVGLHGRDAGGHLAPAAPAGRERGLDRATGSRWTRAAPARCGSPSSGCGTRATSTAARRW